MTIETDRVYHDIGRRVPLTKRVSILARNRIHELFMKSMRPERHHSIIDIGASDDESDETNILEKRYPWPERITCCSLGAGTEIRAAFPQVKHVHIDRNAPLPFPDGSFDIAWSSAVLEHVGGRVQRQAFVREAARVAKAFFLVVPHKWFPIDPHTGLPLLHYVPAAYRALLRNTSLAVWAKQENLDFLDSSVLKREWPLEGKPEIRRTGLALGFFSSNIAMIRRAA